MHNRGLVCPMDTHTETRARHWNCSSLPLVCVLFRFCSRSTSNTVVKKIILCEANVILFFTSPNKYITIYPPLFALLASRPLYRNDSVSLDLNEIIFKIYISPYFGLINIVFVVTAAAAAATMWVVILLLIK